MWNIDTYTTIYYVKKLYFCCITAKTAFLQVGAGWSLATNIYSVIIMTLFNEEAQLDMHPTFPGSSVSVHEYINMVCMQLTE